MPLKERNLKKRKDKQKKDSNQKSWAYIPRIPYREYIVRESP